MYLTLIGKEDTIEKERQLLSCWKVCSSAINHRNMINDILHRNDKYLIEAMKMLQRQKLLNIKTSLWVEYILSKVKRV